MIWESTTFVRELHEERLREAERERQFRSIQAAQRTSSPGWSAQLSNWIADWKVWTGYQKVLENRELTLKTGDR